MTTDVFDELLRIDGARTQGWLTTSGHEVTGRSVRGPGDELLASCTSYARPAADRNAFAASVNALAPLVRIAKAAEAWVADQGTDSPEGTPRRALEQALCVGRVALLRVVDGILTDPSGALGQAGVRDPDHPCVEFEPGSPAGGDCMTDGHYLCAECVQALPRRIAARSVR